MDIGQLRHRAVVQRLDPDAQDEIGQPVESWVKHADVHCRIKHQAGAQEGQKAGSVIAMVRIEIRVRYRTDITTAMRISHRGKLYRIVGVRPNEMNLEWTDIDCELFE